MTSSIKAAVWGTAVGPRVGVGTRVGVGSGVGGGVGLATRVAVGLGARVGTRVGAGGGVAVGEGVTVGIGVKVGAGDGLAPGVGEVLSPPQADRIFSNRNAAKAAVTARFGRKPGIAVSITRQWGEARPMEDPQRLSRTPHLVQLLTV